MHPIGEKLRDLLRSIGGRLSASKREDVDDWFDHYEWSLAVDILADALYVEAVKLTSAERALYGEVILEIGLSLEDYAYLKLAEPEGTAREAEGDGHGVDTR